MSFVQGATATAAASTLNISYPGNNTLGNILVIVTRLIAPSAPATISDSAGNVWVKDYESVVLSTNWIAVWHCLNAKGAANTVTVSAASATFIIASIGEWAGNSGTNTLDTATFIATGTSVTATAKAITTSQSDIMIACAVEATASATQATAGGGFTTRETTSGTFYDTVLADQIAAAGTYTATINYGISSSWGIVVLAFNTTSGAGFNLWKPQGTIIGSNVNTQSVSGNACIIYDTTPQILAGPNVFKAWNGNPITGNVNYYESADGITGWTAYGSNPVVTGSSLDANKIPVVYKVGSTYYLYTGTLASGITVRTSSDGLSWSSHGVQIALGGVGAWDHTSLNQLNICEITGGTWYAYYTGSNSGNTPPSAIGLATSTDGIVWTKSGTTPKITAPNTTYGMGQCTFFKAAGTYYCLASKEPDLTASNTQLDAGGYVSLYLWSAPTYTGPWTQLQYNGAEVMALYAAIPADFSTKLAVTMDVTNCSQIGDPEFARNCVTDPNGLDISVNSNIYCYFTISWGFGIETGTNVNVAFNTTPAQVVTTLQGIYNAPVSGNPAFNLITSATDPGTGTNANPIGAPWTQLSSAAGFGAAQRASNKIEPAATATSSDSWYTGTWPSDQWSQVTVATCAASSFVGPDIHMQVDGTQTAYRSYWNGTLGSPGSWVLQKDIGGTAGPVATITNLTLTAGDTLALVSIQGNVMMYWNGYLLYAMQAVNVISGSPGFLLYAVTAVTNAQLSAWAGGNAFQASPLPPSAGGGSYMQAFRQFANKKGGLS